MDRHALIFEIHRAFSGVRRDPAQSIHQAQLCDRGMTDDPASPAEWRRAGKRDAETDWTEVPGESIDECDAALSFFTPASWRFYLPAYLCRSLFHFSAPNDFVTELLCRVIFHLTLGGDASLRAREYILERHAQLDEPQRGAVIHFLEFVERESLMLIKTTNSYWHTYDSAKAALQSCWQPTHR